MYRCLILLIMKESKTLIKDREETDEPDDLIQRHVVYRLMTTSSNHHSQYAYSREREIPVRESSLMTVVVT